MNCECNKNKIIRPVLRHTQGNHIMLGIPVRFKWHLVNDGVEEIVEQGNMSAVDSVTVELSRGKKVYTYKPTVYNNQLQIEDNGKLPVGTYDITIVMDGTWPMRYKQRTLLMVVDDTESGRTYANDEINVLSVYPVVEGEITAISFGDGKAVIRENGKFKGDDTPDNGKAEITAVYGDGHLVFEDGKAKIIL